MSDKSGTLRELIAAELARNDQCGAGPVSEGEYLADADALVDLVRDVLTSDVVVEAADRAYRFARKDNETMRDAIRAAIAYAIRTSVGFASSRKEH